MKWVSSESTGTRQKIRAQAFLLLTRHETIRIAFTTFFASRVAMRCLFAEHFFVVRNFSPAFGYTDANRFARRFFLTAGEERNEQYA